jgi:hypothetical protein
MIPEENECISDGSDTSDASDVVENENPDYLHSDTASEVGVPQVSNNNTTTPITSGSVPASWHGSPLAENLERFSLFNISKMTLEWERIQNRAGLLRSQFSKRSPQLSRFLPKPSSHPLPQTDGLTLVEQLIQLGERCQWITQKFEHLWFYERTLDEHFFFTLLRVEPLFDLTTLTSLFRNENRNKGAGVCSSMLMDKVVSMVNEMIKKAERSDETEEKFTFDAANILDRQYQPKFCASVEVTLRPYRGHDRYVHMAHHFREVFTGLL